MEFNCRLIGPHNKIKTTPCYEENALLFPGMEYTVSYAMPNGARGPVVVSVRSAVFTGGHVWKSSPHTSCRVLKIRLIRAKK